MPTQRPLIEATSAVSVLGLFLTVSFLVMGTGGQAANGQRLCTVDAVSGMAAEVAVDADWQPVGEGESVPENARIRTGPDTRLHISCDDGISVTIGTATEVLLGGLIGASGPDRNIGVRLMSGIAGFVAPRHSWNKFEVATEVAIASVRSTEWLVESDSEGTTAIFTRRGRVDVLAGSTQLSLGAGEGVTVSADAIAAPVKVWSTARIAKAGEALGYNWK